MIDPTPPMLHIMSARLFGLGFDGMANEMGAAADAWELAIKYANYAKDDKVVMQNEIDVLRARLAEEERALEDVAEDALWHDPHPNSEALDDIRVLLHAKGYTSGWAHDRNERRNARDILAALVPKPEGYVE